ncbi:MAG: class I SAM-dependent methyltransferase [Planctomycetota bacterium]
MIVSEDMKRSRQSSTASPMPVLTVSRATTGFIQRGHPWVRPDRFTRGLDTLTCGEPCLLIDERGMGQALALADPEAPVCARVYSTRTDRPFDPASAAEHAWERRKPLHNDPATNCYRLVHGEADGLPGLQIDRFGPCLSAVITARCIMPYLDVILGVLAARLPGATVVIHEHLDDVRRAAVVSRRWPNSNAADPSQIIEGHELGVHYPLRPGAGIASGLYIDQRMNRAWLGTRCRGKSVLNLFAYTGAFSLSLLSAGAARAIDVDLGGPALERATTAAARNGLSERHTTVHGDARTFCASDRTTHDIVIIDPPTAAQGAGGWLLRRDFPELLRLAWERVAPGGLLFATCNTLGKPFPLRETLMTVCGHGQFTNPPGPGPDVPQLRGFPEGLPFRCAALVKPAH